MRIRTVFPCVAMVVGLFSVPGCVAGAGIDDHASAAQSDDAVVTAPHEAKADAHTLGESAAAAYHSATESHAAQSVDTSADKGPDFKIIPTPSPCILCGLHFCGELGAAPCNDGQDCYGDNVLNAAGTCQSCSAVGPSFAITSVTYDYVNFTMNLAQPALGQLSLIDAATGQSVGGWYEVFDATGTYSLVIQPGSTYVLQFTPTASVTSTGGCYTTAGPEFTAPYEPPPCAVGAACEGACTSCNDGSCQCSGTFTSCANAYEPVCTGPSNPCGNHGGVNSGVGCAQE